MSSGTNPVSISARLTLLGAQNASELSNLSIDNQAEVTSTGPFASDFNVGLTRTNSIITIDGVSQTDPDELGDYDYYEFEMAFFLTNSIGTGGDFSNATVATAEGFSFVAYDLDTHVVPP